MNDLTLTPPISATGPVPAPAPIVAAPPEPDPSDIRAEIPGAEALADAPPASNIVEASSACKQANPELAGMPGSAPKVPLVFTADQLASAGVVFQATDVTKSVEINSAAQTALIASAAGYLSNEIIAAVLAAYGIEGQVQLNTHSATATLSIWQSMKSPKDDAVVNGANPRPRGNLTIDELLALHESTCGAAREIMRAKNADYTDGSVDPFSNFRTAESLGIPAEIGLMIRMLDKMKRVQTFVNKGTLQVKGESVEDSILDLVNYSILLKGIIVSRRLTAVEEVA